MDTTLPAPVRTYIAASNAFDGDAVIAAFTDDAVVNDTRREFSGLSAIRAWLDREIIGDKVTMTVTATRERYGLVIIDAVMDGNYDKSGLPDPLVLTYYFVLADDHIAQLIIIHNEPTPSWAQP
jgi:hypothetical protein